MDRLQNIDDLLKASATQLATENVDDSDWLSVEKKLKQRKNRIYAVWFFLALILISSSIVFFLPENTNDTLVNEQNSPALNDAPLSISPAAPAQENPTEGIITIPQKTPTATSDASSPATQGQTIAQSGNNNTTNQNIITDNITPESVVDVTPPEAPVVSNEPIHVETEVIAPELDVVSDVVEPISEDIATEDQPVITPKDLENHIPVKPGFNIDSKPELRPYTEIGISFTPGMSNKNISEDPAMAGMINRSYYSEVFTDESTGFTTTAGLNVQRHFNRHLFAATGLFITQRSEMVNYDYIIDESPVVPNGVITGYDPLDPRLIEYVSYNGSNSYHFIEIPVNLGYKQKISPNFEIRGQVGLSYLQLFQTRGVKADYTYLDLRDLSTYNWNSSNVSTNVKLGIYFDRPHFTIGMEPTYSRSLNSLSKASAIQIKPYNYGFNLTANYKLLKK